MLTLLAQYADVANAEVDAGNEGDAFLLAHFDKALALGEWLLWRFNQSVADFPESDPRYGIPAGDDEADTFLGTEYGDGRNFQHFYSSAAECSQVRQICSKGVWPSTMTSPTPRRSDG